MLNNIAVAVILIAQPRAGITAAAVQYYVYEWMPGTAYCDIAETLCQRAAGINMLRDCYAGATSVAAHHSAAAKHLVRKSIHAVVGAIDAKLLPYVGASDVKAARETTNILQRVGQQLYTLGGDRAKEMAAEALLRISRPSCSGAPQLDAKLAAACDRILIESLDEHSAADPRL